MTRIVTAICVLVLALVAGVLIADAAIGRRVAREQLRWIAQRVGIAA